ncbi:hypothetical protein SLA2020_403760 [Shorea laevis]
MAQLENILLNEKLEPNISNPILSNCNLKEYVRSGTMDDVLNFGVVLFQLLMGRKSKSLVEEAWDAIMRGGSISAITYPSLNGAIAATEFRNILSIAVSCTTPNGHQRSNMKEVVQKLEETQILV